MTKLTRSLIALSALSSALLSFFVIIAVWTGVAIFTKGPFNTEIKETVKKIYINEKDSLVNIKGLT